jgi:hypothetical protein
MKEDMKQIFTWLGQNNLTAHCREFWDISYENSSQQTQDTFHLISSDDKILQYSHAAQDIHWSADDWDEEKKERTKKFNECISDKNNKIITEVLDLKNKISVMVNKLPAEAIAFIGRFIIHPLRSGVYISSCQSIITI